MVWTTANHKGTQINEKGHPLQAIGTAIPMFKS